MIKLLKYLWEQCMKCVKDTVSDMVNIRPACVYADLSMNLTPCKDHIPKRAGRTEGIITLWLVHPLSLRNEGRRCRAPGDSVQKLSPLTLFLEGLAKKPRQMSQAFEMWASPMHCCHTLHCCKKSDGPAKSPRTAKWTACVKECHLNTCVSHR